MACRARVCALAKKKLTLEISKSSIRKLELIKRKRECTMRLRRLPPDQRA